MPGNIDPKKPRLDSRLAERLARKKAQLDQYRPLPLDTIKLLNDDLRVFLTYHSNAIEGNTLSLRETQMVIDYGMTMRGHSLREYLEAANHSVAAIKRGGRWYSTLQEVNRYKSEVEVRIARRERAEPGNKNK